uniref:Uncharacterized protein n=1 Tax=Anguilla anguilla TaxID=7936 RepID=A0A0E9VQ17_ANGAN
MSDSKIIQSRYYHTGVGHPLIKRYAISRGGSTLFLREAYL